MKKINQSAKSKAESKLKGKKAMKDAKLEKKKVLGGRGRHGGPFQI